MMFSKSKGTLPPEPGLCGRCKVRPGTVRLHFISAADSPGERDAWLCQPCVEEIQRGRPGES